MWQIVSTIVYFVLGVVLFGSTILIFEKLTPFSIRREIEEDQNSALAILMGAGLIALSIVLAAAIR
jgi:uncharacterized membrane protein YjfL (UPF0719 family)